jgi:hypothetical protein
MLGQMQARGPQFSRVERRAAALKTGQSAPAGVAVDYIF